MVRGLPAVAFAALLLAAPPAGAAWLAGSGAPEPNTAWDDARVMWQGPNQAPRDRVYFNGFLLQSGSVAATDVTLDGARVASPVAYANAAMLGFWRDCNRDGYVGFKLAPAGWGSLSSYPRRLADASPFPVDPTVCPLGSPNNPTDPSLGSPSAFIDEFRWIGPNAMWAAPAQQSYNSACGNLGDPVAHPGSVFNLNCMYLPSAGGRYDVTDPLARVWADWGVPGSRHLADGGTVPRGLFNDSNGLLDYLDFYAGEVPSDVLGNVWTGKPNVGRCPPEDPTFLGGPGGTCGLWPLYQAKRLVNDSTTNGGNGAHPRPIVSVFDVEQESGNSPSTPCDDGLVAPTVVKPFAIPDVSARLNPNFLVQGSIAGTFSNVWIGTDAGRFDGQCAPGAPTTLAVEAEQDDLLTTHVRPDDTLQFVYDQRTHALRPVGLDDAPTGPTGAHASSAVKGNVGWYGRTFLAQPPRFGWGALGTGAVTYYADVTSAALNAVGALAAVALPSGQNAFRYGVPAPCGSVTTGPSHVDAATSWDCSVTSWESRRTRDKAAGRPMLGDDYDLRDVDCYDDTLAEAAGATVSPQLAQC